MKSTTEDVLRGTAAIPNLTIAPIARSSRGLVARVSLRFWRKDAARRSKWAFLLPLALIGCAGWRGVELQRTPTLRDGDVLEFHAQDKTVRLHGVRFDRDSLSGVPWLNHLKCDSCRVRYAIAEISSARVGHPETIGWVVVLVPLFILYSFWHAFSGSGT
jgi:hypothetical protein